MEIDPERIDLTDLASFAHGFPHEVFRWLRREAPVWWHPPTSHTPDAEGFWVVSRHAGVQAVFRDIFNLGPDFPVDGSQFDVLLRDGPRQHYRRF